ncbi:hypothetical protein T484DRAFT_1981200 [Baffinella frigidus]|nr:hypothetical protein T484DRAFT_1981200 [Cryptophyta sp. CCMP2293]
MEAMRFRDAAAQRKPFANVLSHAILLLAIGVHHVYASAPGVALGGAGASSIGHPPRQQHVAVARDPPASHPVDADAVFTDADGTEEEECQISVADVRDMAARQVRGAALMAEIRTMNRDKLQEAERRLAALGGGDDESSAQHRALWSELVDTLRRKEAVLEGVTGLEAISQGTLRRLEKLPPDP